VEKDDDLDVRGTGGFRARDINGAMVIGVWQTLAELGFIALVFLADRRAPGLLIVDPGIPFFSELSREDPGTLGRVWSCCELFRWASAR